MPFCTQCGSNIDAAAIYCSNCGARQQAASSSFAQSAADPFSRLNGRTATILCYIPVIGVFACGFVLASQRFRHDARLRFDAFQGLYLFVAWLIVSSALPSIFLGINGFFPHGLISLLKLFLVGVWVYLLIQASSGRQIRMPIIGDLAARSIAEQL